MRTGTGRTLLACGAALVGAGALAGEEVHRWNLLSSPAFTQCLAHNACDGNPECLLSEVVLQGDCDVECGDLITSPPGCYTSVNATANWLGFFYAAYGLCPGWDSNQVSFGHVSAQRIDESTLVLTAALEVWNVSDTLEVAVFRFDGDPAVFEGLEFETAIDLVARGVLLPEDILFQSTLTFPDADDLEESIDVTGIPDDEIVVLASGVGPIFDCHAVPASSPGGALLTALLVAGAGAWRLKRVR